MLLEPNIQFLKKVTFSKVDSRALNIVTYSTGNLIEGQVNSRNVKDDTNSKVHIEFKAHIRFFTDFFTCNI